MAKDKRGGKRHGKSVSHLKNYKNAEIPTPKLKNYILNPNKGKDKATLFNNLGYNMGNYERFKDDVRKGLQKNKAIKFETNKYGDTEYQVDMVLGINRKELITTGWVISKGSKIPRFITAYKSKVR